MTADLQSTAAQAAQDATRLAQEAAAAQAAADEAAAKAAAQQEAKRRRRLERFVAEFDAEALSQAVTEAMAAFEDAVVEGDWSSVLARFDKYQEVRVEQVAALQTYNSVRVALGHESGQLSVPSRMAELLGSLELALGKRAQRLRADAHDSWHARAYGE